MLKLKALATASLVLLIASCSLPDENGTKKMMDRYWQFYMNEQYDSLKAFYMEGSLPDAQISQLIKSMQEAREKYGNIKRVNNFFIGAGKSLTGEESIELKYQVEHEKAKPEYQFKYKKKEDEFRIVEQNLLP